MHRFLLLIILLFSTAPVLAQGTPPDGCSADDLLDLLYASSDAIEQPGADLDAALSDAISAIQKRRTTCFGLSFEGETGGIVGPFTLPAGAWIFEGTFHYYSATINRTLTPDCERNVSGTGLSSGSDGEAVDQSVIQTDRECRLLIEVNASQPWMLTFTAVE